MDNFDRLIAHPDHKIRLRGLEFTVRDGVFTPDPEISYSSLMVLDNLPNVKDKDVLDMGTGCGVIAIFCSNQGARKIVAVDNEEIALKNTAENAENLGAENLELVNSNLFENVDGKFDYIFANLPICDDLWETKERTTDILKRFLKDSKKYLKIDGKVFLTWFSISDVQQVRDMLDELTYKYIEKSDERLNYIWYLFEIS